MAISTINDVVAAMAAATVQQLEINKAQHTSQIAGAYTSTWRGAGVPGVGAVPGAWAICDNALLGGWPLRNPAAGKASYIGRASVLSNTSSGSLIVYDRLGHMGGLSGVLTTAQAVGADITGSGSNLAARRGAADYSEVQWWLEWYTATGATGVNATVTYTNGAGVSGQTCIVPIPVSTAAARAIRILPTNGDSIRSIESVTLSATTGTAGSFGVTAARPRLIMPIMVGNYLNLMDWQACGLAKIEDSSCLALFMVAPTTNTGTPLGELLIIQG